MIGLALLILALGAVAAAPFVAEARRRPADPAEASGSMIDTPFGPTHYQWHGAEGGPVALCIHGLTTPSCVFDRLVPHLVAQGYRVLTYDLPARGHTPPVEGDQDPAYFQSQLTGLLLMLGLDEVDLLIGYSMGGSIATSFAAAAPDRVERLVLLAPAGLYHDPGELTAALRRIPGGGDWVMRVLGGVILRRGIDGSNPDLARRQRAETRKQKYLPAVLSSLRHTLDVRLPDKHRAIAAMGIPVLAIWGEEDTVIPVSNIGRLAELNRSAEQVALKGAGHGLPDTHADEVAAAIAEFCA